MKNLVVYVHGKGGSAQEAEHYKSLFPKDEVIGFDYHSQTPWEAKKEFLAFFTEQKKRYDQLTLVANSIGAYFALSSLDETLVDRAYFISSVVDMENLICNTITRVAITTEEDAEKKGTEMGRKYIVPYGLYRAEGYVSANLARKTTGFSEEDLELLWQAILNMFELDHSAARGKMAVRELIIFKHDSELGNAPAYKLFDLVKVNRRESVAVPRTYSDYIVDVDEAHLPSGVSCIRK